MSHAKIAAGPIHWPVNAGKKNTADLIIPPTLSNRRSRSPTVRGRLSDPLSIFGIWLDFAAELISHFQTA